MRNSYESELLDDICAESNQIFPGSRVLKIPIIGTIPNPILVIKGILEV